MAGFDERKLMDYLKQAMPGANVAYGADASSTTPTQPPIFGLGAPEAAASPALDPHPVDPEFDLPDTPTGVPNFESPEDRRIRKQLELRMKSQIEDQKKQADIQKQLLLNQLQYSQPQVDLKPALSLADAWAGNKAGLEGYTAPPSPVDASQKAQDNFKNYLGTQDKISDNERDYFKTLLSNNQNKQALASSRLGLMEDRLAGQAVSAIDNHPTIKNLGERLNQIQIDKHTLQAGGVITPQVLNEISQGIANALRGGSGAGFHATEMTSYATAQTKLAELKQRLTSHPEEATSPEIKAFIMSTLDRLESGYQNAQYNKAQQLVKGRNYVHSPATQQALKEKIASYKPPSAGAPEANAASAPMSFPEFQAARRAGKL